MIGEHHMIPRYIIIFLIVFLANNVLALERSKFGLGVIAGEPTGITAKYMIDDVNAIDGGIGWETSGDNEFHIYADYLYHMYDLIKVRRGNLPLYFGGGLRFVDRENQDNKFGIRLPVGVEYLFENVSLGAFFEFAPVLNLTPDTDFDLEGGIGIRFFF
jgi:hypothetical protein